MCNTICLYGLSGINGDEEVFTRPDRMATYPGGFSAMMDHINSNMNYPKEAKDKSLRGRVMVVFQISKEGPSVM